MSISSQEFRNSLSMFATGVTVVTGSDDEGRHHGITVSAFCSVSLEPPLVLVCIEKNARCHDIFLDSGRFVVNILGEDQEAVSERFATQLEDKFDGMDFTVDEDGLPVLDGTIAYVTCELDNAYEGGDHTIFIGRVVRTEVTGGEPLLYSNSRYREIAG